MKPKVFFITGTDTGVGKTWVSLQLLSQCKQRGLTTAAIKPIASGADKTATGLCNADALLLQQAMTLFLPYAEVNPFCYETTAAPHIAALEQQGHLSVANIVAGCKKVIAKQADVTLIEGIGGWQVPLNQDETLADLAKALAVPVILVVGLRLGCLNHAVLTLQSMQSAQLPIAGWIANQVDVQMQYQRENILTLRHYLSIPYLGEMPYQHQSEKIVSYPLDLDLLLKN